MINFNDIYVDFPEYSYFKELSGSDKIEYLIEIYDLELRKQNLDQNLAEGLMARPDDPQVEPSAQPQDNPELTPDLSV